ncbi:hypothetical protein [Rhizobium aethiopicum]|uniref:Uncharacterized protein n=1 Tax=Rhizobium aethiopicum TaxID=1138170 RepID=A0A7W6MHJ2_9HYPH|nr:hypothetical protein [Rhizobium aethiopicum]MBB4192746.1 hypothetical protein [Rhizobium aethiopicum]
MKSPLLTFSSCLRHAFFEGAGYKDLERISDDDQRRWVEYDPTDLAPFKRMQEALAATDELLAGLRDLVETVQSGVDAGLILSVDGKRPDLQFLNAAVALLAKHGGGQ